MTAPPSFVPIRDTYCVLRGDIVRREPCGSCDGTAPVLSCRRHGECTIHYHAIENAAGELLKVCDVCPERDADGYVDQSIGFGDTVAWLIHRATFGLVKMCAGCGKRRDWLNRVFPYKARRVSSAP